MPLQPGPRLIIVGAGITGLSAAWELQQADPHLTLTILEAGPRAGGKVISDQVDLEGLGRFTIDGGPESFVTRKPEAWDLAHELGLSGQILAFSNEAKNIYILRDGRPQKVPLDPGSFLSSPLLSMRGKLRMGLEPFIPPRLDEGDESLLDFGARRLGTEAADHLIGPILGGIYNSDPGQQSILTSSPIMREMERDHGGLFRGAFARMRAKKAAQRAGEPPRPPFFSLRDGSGVLIEALLRQLRAELRLNATVESIEADPEGYTLRLHSGETLHAEGLLLTCPANAAAAMLRGHFESLSSALAAIPHSSLGTVSLAYHQADLPDGDLRGLMIPRREGRAIDALTWTSRKAPDRAPAGASLLRVFIGGARPDLATGAESELIQTVRAELGALLDIHAEPLFARAYRWPGSYPQTLVGHLDQVAQIESLLPPAMQVAGASYRGVGLPDCIRQGRAAARALLKDDQVSRAQPAY